MTTAMGDSDEKPDQITFAGCRWSESGLEELHLAARLPGTRLIATALPDLSDQPPRGRANFVVSTGKGISAAGELFCLVQSVLL